MSAALADVLFQQRLFRQAGFYNGKLDGRWGPKTNAASAAWDAAYRDAALTTKVADGIELDGRTEYCLRTLLPLAQRRARYLLAVLIDAGLDARITSGTRSYAEQDALWRQGRFHNPGPVVTKARGGQSNHNFGLAWDIGLFEGGRYLTGKTAAETAEYERAGALAASVPGIEWGGTWKTLRDLPHYQLATGLKVAEVRRRFEAGEMILTEEGATT